MLCSDKGAEFVSFMRYDLRPNKHVLPARLCMNSCTPLSGGSAGRRPVAALHSMGQRHQGGRGGLRALNATCRPNWPADTPAAPPLTPHPSGLSPSSRWRTASQYLQLYSCTQHAVGPKGPCAAANGERRPAGGAGLRRRGRQGLPGTGRGVGSSLGCPQRPGQRACSRPSLPFPLSRRRPALRCACVHAARSAAACLPELLRLLVLSGMMFSGSSNSQQPLSLTSRC